MAHLLEVLALLKTILLSLAAAAAKANRSARGKAVVKVVVVLQQDCCQVLLGMTAPALA